MTTPPDEPDDEALRRAIAQIEAATAAALGMGQAAAQTTLSVESYRQALEQIRALPPGPPAIPFVRLEPDPPFRYRFPVLYGVPVLRPPFGIVNLAAYDDGPHPLPACVRRALKRRLPRKLKKALDKSVVGWSLGPSRRPPPRLGARERARLRGYHAQRRFP
jgi:hypothetical protein